MGSAVKRKACEYTGGIKKYKALIGGSLEVRRGKPYFLGGKLAKRIRKRVVEIEVAHHQARKVMTWKPTLRKNSAKSSRTPIGGVPVVEPEDPLGGVKQATRGVNVQGHQIKAVKETRQNRKRLKYAKGSITSDPWRAARSKGWSKQLKASKGGQAVPKSRRVLNKNKRRRSWSSP